MAVSTEKIASMVLTPLIVALTMGIVGCGEMATLPEEAGFGSRPVLPAAQTTLRPTVRIAPAKGWPAGATPAAAAARLAMR